MAVLEVLPSSAMASDRDVEGAEQTPESEKPRTAIQGFSSKTIHVQEWMLR